MNTESVYSRKISSKEENDNFIFILKSKLSFFPELEDIFELTDGVLSKDVTVESYPCTCRGPDRPHEHYFILWEGLKAGNKVEIIKRSKNRYDLKVLD